MKNRIIKLIEERIEEKEERILTLEHDKAIYLSNYRYWSYKSVSEEAIRRANKGIRILKKDIERLERIVERLR